MSERMEIAIASVRTPLGRVWILATEEGLCETRLGDRGAPSRREARVRGVKYLRRRRWTDATRRALTDYFAGREPIFDLKLDFREGTPFERRVWEAARRVPYGSVASYGALAARIGTPSASRAVGNALGKNPIPVVVPCHRVIHGDRSIGGFSSGLTWKRFLLELEQGQLELQWAKGRRRRGA
jgi:O-6-methylguanine DNA methyltransferase